MSSACSIRWATSWNGATVQSHTTPTATSSATNGAGTTAPHLPRRLRGRPEKSYAFRHTGGILSRGSASYVRRNRAKVRDCITSTRGDQNHGERSNVDEER